MVMVELIAAFLSSFFFGILFGIPPRDLWIAGLVGLLGWTVYISFRGVNIILAVFIASLVISLVSEILARVLKKPVTVFIIPGTIPLVPGGVAYYAMVAFMEGDFNLGLAKAAETLLSAGSIAAGEVLIGAFFRVFLRRDLNIVKKD